MRVNFLLEQVLAPVPGGTGRYSKELAAALVRTAGAGDSVRTWTAWHRNPSAADVEGAGGPTRLALPRRGLVAAWQVGRGPAPRGGDLVHAPTLLMPPKRRQALVVTIHDTVPWTHPHTLTPRGVRWHRVMAERAARFADAVVVPTMAVAEELGHFVPELERARIHPLGAGVAAAFRVEPAEVAEQHVAQRYELPDRYFVSLATLEPRKGLDLLIAALARLGADALPLLVIGQPGWGEVDVPALLRRHGLADSAVRVLGRLPDPELAIVMRGAAALVMPSRAEGFGLPVAEAMSVGTPVVCSDLPALVEVAGGAAIVVAREDVDALAEGLTRVLDPAVSDPLRRAGPLRASIHGWDDVARRAWALYADVVGPH